MSQEIQAGKPTRREEQESQDGSHPVDASATNGASNIAPHCFSRRFLNLLSFLISFSFSLSRLPDYLCHAFQHGSQMFFFFFGLIAPCSPSPSVLDPCLTPSADGAANTGLPLPPLNALKDPTDSVLQIQKQCTSPTGIVLRKSAPPFPNRSVNLGVSPSNPPQECESNPLLPSAYSLMTHADRSMAMHLVLTV